MLILPLLSLLSVAASTDFNTNSKYYLSVKTECYSDCFNIGEVNCCNDICTDSMKTQHKLYLECQLLRLDMDLLSKNLVNETCVLKLIPIKPNGDFYPVFGLLAIMVLLIYYPYSTMATLAFILFVAFLNHK
jgi:hypothetical protein